jgi:hypothetical protein
MYSGPYEIVGQSRQAGLGWPPRLPRQSPAYRICTRFSTAVVKRRSGFETEFPAQSANSEQSIHSAHAAQSLQHDSGWPVVAIVPILPKKAIIAMARKLRIVRGVTRMRIVVKTRTGPQLTTARHDIPSSNAF